MEEPNCKKKMKATVPTSTAAHTLSCVVGKPKPIKSLDEFLNSAMIYFQKKYEVIII